MEEDRLKEEKSQEDKPQEDMSQEDKPQEDVPLEDKTQEEEACDIADFSEGRNLGTYIRKIIKFICIPYLLSLVAVVFSGFTLWDNYFNFKLDVAIGKQIKLWIAHIDEGSAEKGKGLPIILMSLAFSNSGGKTESLQYVKLLVTLTSDNQDSWSKEFKSVREYDTMLPAVFSTEHAIYLPHSDQEGSCLLQLSNVI